MVGPLAVMFRLNSGEKLYRAEGSPDRLCYPWWAMQLFIHFLRKSDESFTWEKKKLVPLKGWPTWPTHPPSQKLTSSQHTLRVIFFKQFIPLLTSDRSVFSRLSVLQLFVDLYYNITILHPGICMAVWTFYIKNLYMAVKKVQNLWLYLYKNCTLWDVLMASKYCSRRKHFYAKYSKQQIK